MVSEALVVVAPAEVLVVAAVVAVVVVASLALHVEGALGLDELRKMDLKVATPRED